MSEYKRLTGKRETPLTMSMWGGTSKELMIYNRLADLEDKIESGLLVELPCKVGDTVYELSFYDFDDCEKNQCEFLGAEYGNGYWCYKTRYGEKSVECVNIEEDKMIDLQQILRSFNSFGKTVFLTRAEAEARLKELRDER